MIFIPMRNYSITYRDPNYPCRCACHNPYGSLIKHIVACCQNYSFGPKIGTYVGTGDKGRECFEFEDGRVFEPRPHELKDCVITEVE